MTIHKFILELKELQAVLVPRCRTFLSSQIQDGRICVWALVDPDEQKVKTKFRIVGTGEPFDDCGSWKYLATVQMDGYVWHVFTEKV